jgi:hypothetical protein
MVHFRPETVDTKAVDFVSTAQTATISPIGPVSYGWFASDLNPEGPVGFELVKVGLFQGNLAGAFFRGCPKASFSSADTSKAHHRFDSIPRKHHQCQRI